MLGRVRSDPRIRAPILLFAVAMGLPSLQRLLIRLTMRDRFASVPGVDLLEGFLIGLRFDAWVASVLVTPLLVLLAIAWPRLVARRGYQCLVAAYGGLTCALLVFSGIADYYFFQEFSERLNHKAIDYLAFPATYAMIWRDYPVVLALLATLGVLLGSAWAFRRAVFPAGFDAGSWRRLVIWLVVVTPLLAVGFRGSLGPMAINTAPAYFSNSMSLSQWTLNGLFTLREALVSRTLRAHDLGRHIALLPQDEAFAVARQLLASPQDRFLERPDNPLLRLTDTGRPCNDYNVVLVIMESFSWPCISALGGHPSLTPTITALANEGVLMGHCFAVGPRTSRAMAGIASGFPDLPGASVTTRVQAEGAFLTLGHVLGRRGYQTMFLYGGQPIWDHLQAFLHSNGFSKTIFEDQLGCRTFRNILGWCDEDLFNQAHREFLAMGDRPFFAMLLTLSFHRPFEIPPARLREIDPAGRNANEMNCARYADWAIGHFMEQARQADYFKRTLFVFVADHRGGFMDPRQTPESYHIPFILYAPSILGSQAKRIDTVCSQTDVAPTIMSVLGGTYEHCFFGSSVLDRPSDSGMAFMQDGSGVFWLIAANRDLVELPFDAPPRLSHYGPTGDFVPASSTDPNAIARRDELRRQAVAVLQTATLLFERGSHRLTQPPDRGARASR